MKHLSHIPQYNELIFWDLQPVVASVGKFCSKLLVRSLQNIFQWL
jgi:hypothetical protein